MITTNLDKSNVILIINDKILFDYKNIININYDISSSYSLMMIELVNIDSEELYDILQLKDTRAEVLLIRDNTFAIYNYQYCDFEYKNGKSKLIFTLYSHFYQFDINSNMDELDRYKTYKKYIRNNKFKRILNKIK